MSRLRRHRYLRMRVHNLDRSQLEAGMISDSYRLTTVYILLSAIILTSCVARHAEQSSALPTQQDAVGYYIGKLPDQTYVRTYGDDEHPRHWYIAAEALGELGKPAIPALIARLDTSSPYELKLVLYALMLASQDPVLRVETQSDYLQLETVLTEESNAVNRRLALAWWQKYGYLWR